MTRVYDLPMTADGSDVDFSRDALVSGLDEYRQAVLLRLSHEFTFDREPNGDPRIFGIDLVKELGNVGGEASLGIRASAAIMNDPRFTAQLLRQDRKTTGSIVEISLEFEIIVDETQETFSLEVLVANVEVRLVP